MAANPMIIQGTLNRVLASVIVPSIPTLNITSSNMGKNLLSMEFDEDFTAQIGTATGVVNSPAPYVMSTVNISLLRSQSLSDSWIAQAISTAIIGQIIIVSDTSTFSKKTLNNTSIIKATPGRMDGTDPIVELHLRGVFYLNNNLWSV